MSQPYVFVLSRHSNRGDRKDIKSVHLLYETAAERAQRLAGFKLTWQEHNAHGRWWESDPESTGGGSWWTIEETELHQ